MLRYFQRKNRDNNATTAPSVSNLHSTTRNHVIHAESSSAQNVAPSCAAENDVNENLLASLPSDPGLRTPIFDYDPNISDRVRRAYLQRGPCHPKKHTYPTRISGGRPRKFCGSWFNEHPSWLEYIILTDAVFCLCCYLFRAGSGDSFVGKGFRGWRKKERLHIHIGGPKSAHNKALKNCEVLMNRKQHIDAIIEKQSEEEKRDNRKRLRASINCVRFLLRQGLAFRGHDETEASLNRGNFIELLKWLADNNEEIKAVVLENAPGNQKLIASDIQKDITKCFSSEILSEIIKELGDGPFTLLLDESKDISLKEQLAIVLRYVHKGHVIERFVGIEHVTSTTSNSLKETVDDFFSRHGLSISRLRGQGYDGESNMREELYVVMSYLVNVVAVSAKRQDMLREKQAEAVFEALCSDLAVDSDKKFEAKVLLDSLQNFNFIFSLHLMKKILGITNDLSKALQRKDQDIVNAMKLVTVCRERLQIMRDKE
ncbi:zinc finger MYM-type protein 1-like [Papaver somniferum]|uniref:zinc finger MYM-type protein 1-like n=1 Tax=Papaver somniferum TaxID=3469 RepID=UPI000E6FAF25|nr:zinc finger MYM-type protein 1-like [Papaver somniferum]